MLRSIPFHIPVRRIYLVDTDEGSVLFVLILALAYLSVPGVLGTTLCRHSVPCCICFLHDDMLLLVLVQCLSIHEDKSILCALFVFPLRLSYVKTMIHWWHKRDRRSRRRRRVIGRSSET